MNRKRFFFYEKKPYLKSNLFNMSVLIYSSVVRNTEEKRIKGLGPEPSIHGLQFFTSRIRLLLVE